MKRAEVAQSLAGVLVFLIVIYGANELAFLLKLSEPQATYFSISVPVVLVGVLVFVIQQREENLGSKG